MGKAYPASTGSNTSYLAAGSPVRLRSKTSKVPDNLFCRMAKSMPKFLEILVTQDKINVFLTLKKNVFLPFTYYYRVFPEPGLAGSEAVTGLVPLRVINFPAIK